MIFLLIIEWSFICKALSPLYYTQGCFVQSLVEIGPGVLENIFKFRQCIFIILLLVPLGKWYGPSFELT